MMQRRKHSRSNRLHSSLVARRRRVLQRTTVPQPDAHVGECVCSFGATRVGPMIERVRLHVATDRFLAGRRGDTIWEAACDYAVLALARLEARLRPTVLAEWIHSSSGGVRSAKVVAAHRTTGGRR